MGIGAVLGMIKLAMVFGLRSATGESGAYFYFDLKRHFL